MADNEIKKLGFEPGKVNRGILTWVVLFVVCWLIFLSKKKLSFPVLYLVGSLLIYLIIYIYNRTRRRQFAAKKSLLFFFSEFGGGF